MRTNRGRVRDFMAGKLVTFTPDMAVLDAIHELVENRIAGAPVIDDHGELVGMLSEFDCLAVVLRAGYHGVPGGPVSEYMTRDVKTINADMSIVDVASLFLESGYRRYPVVMGGRVVGQISRRDVLRALEDLTRASIGAR